MLEGVKGEGAGPGVYGMAGSSSCISWLGGVGTIRYQQIIFILTLSLPSK
jgi:hypothetical protein